MSSLQQIESIKRQLAKLNIDVNRLSLNALAHAGSNIRLGEVTESIDPGSDGVFKWKAQNPEFEESTSGVLTKQDRTNGDLWAAAIDGTRPEVGSIGLFSFINDRWLFCPCGEGKKAQPPTANICIEGNSFWAGIRTLGGPISPLYSDWGPSFFGDWEMSRDVDLVARVQVVEPGQLAPLNGTYSEMVLTIPDGFFNFYSAADPFPANALQVVLVPQSIMEQGTGSALGVSSEFYFTDESIYTQVTGPESPDSGGFDIDMLPLYQSFRSSGDERMYIVFRADPSVTSGIRYLSRGVDCIGIVNSTR